MKETEAQDVFCMAIPEGVDLDHPQLLSTLGAFAAQWVVAQWSGATAEQTPTIKIISAQWHITDKVFEVDEFQPAHDCQECRSGNEKAKQFLRENPGRHIAMANLRYTEHWSD